MVAWTTCAAIRAGNSRQGGIFRTRSSLLGDIVNSGPTFVAAPRLRFPDSIAPQAYSAFRASNQNRQPMIYVGANDGMLHAFNADDGNEVFAFIPRSVFANLRDFASPTYTHKFYVDGSPTVGDAYFDNKWHTMLVSGLNKGGQGVFALDVTDPASLNTEAKAAAAFQWEFTDAQDSDMGYSFSRPSVVRLRRMASGTRSSATATTTPTIGTARTRTSARLATRCCTWSTSKPAC